MKASTGMKVKAIEGKCIGIMIEETKWTGTITKVNKKSIRVNLTEEARTYGEREARCRDIDREVRYTFWKTTSDGIELYKSEGRMYGIIKL